jgi:hypothetical protein
VSNWLRLAVSRELASGRDAAFAILALLRCGDRIGPLLDTIAEARRLQLGDAVAEYEKFDGTRLKQLLTELIRRENAELSDAVLRALGVTSAQVPRAILRWAARGMGR